MKIYKVLVDKIPQSCGQCALMGYISKNYPVCYGIAAPEIREITGNPYDMKYRRSDCPLEAQTGVAMASSSKILNARVTGELCCRGCTKVCPGDENCEKFSRIFQTFCDAYPE